MKDFEKDPDARGRLKLKLPDLPKLVTARGIPYIDFNLMAPGLANVTRLAARYCRGEGLDVGASYFRDNQSNGFPGATVVDLAVKGSGEAEALVQADRSQDYVIASHILEHVQDPEKAIAEAFRVLRSRGFFFTYSPFPGNKEWDPGLSELASQIHTWQPSPGSLSRMLVMAGFRIEYAEHEPDHIHSFVVVGRKT